MLAFHKHPVRYDLPAVKHWNVPPWITRNTGVRLNHPLKHIPCIPLHTTVRLQVRG